MGCLFVGASKQANQVIGRKRDLMTQLLDGDRCCIIPIQNLTRKVCLFIVMHSRFLTISCSRSGYYYSMIPGII